MASRDERRIGRRPTILNGQTIPDRLVDVALELFADRGFEATSVQDVVTAAGVTKGAMYHYFGAKDDLLAEIYTRVLRMQLEHLETFAESSAPIAQRVKEAAADVVVTTVENLASTKIFFRSLHQLTPEHQREVRDQRRRYHDLFRHMLVTGQREGEFREDLDADLVVDYYFGAVHHLPMWWRSERGLDASAVGQLFADLLLRSIRTTDSIESTLAGTSTAR